MERVCFVVQVRAHRLDEYRERHQAVWPEMLAALSAAGWTNYSLFLRPDGLLIGYLETEDFEAAQRADGLPEEVEQVPAQAVGQPHRPVREPVQLRQLHAPIGQPPEHDAPTRGAEIDRGELGHGRMAFMRCEDS